jgi:hypothetical protein
MSARAYAAVYDFELMPYALGDVLTWNVQTAIRSEAAGLARTDIHVCLDERAPASVYQKGLVTPDNSNLFFSELFGAFGTHPQPGNLFVHRRREDMLERLRAAAPGDADLEDYERALAQRGDEDAVIAYFSRVIHSHDRINAFARERGRIPLLRPSLGCGPDVEGLLRTRYAGRRLVAIHVRQRRLDAGYGGEHTYARDSDFLEWHEFLAGAAKSHPDVEFVMLGRLQEKPLEFLRLPNVSSLRVMGLGLGHELSLLLRSDLFIGTSSGFAAMANFSAVPYFITRMTPASCRAYAIEQGAERLPFATERQVLVYEPETRELLARLLERGLAGTPPRAGGPPAPQGPIDVRSWEWERSRWLYPGATTFRFDLGEDYADRESAFLLWPRVREAQTALRRGLAAEAKALAERIAAGFPRLAGRFPELLRLRRDIAAQAGDEEGRRRAEADLAALPAADWRQPLRRLYPLAMRLKYYWGRRHRAPRRLLAMLRG